MALARELGVWVVLGSAHRLERHRPHNSLYIISNHGEVVDRYDKLFAVGGPAEDDADLLHYSPGNHFAVFDVNGVRCGALICHDARYDELYRELLRRGVQLVLHSFHNGHSQQQLREIGDTTFPDWPDRSSYGGIVISAMQTYAANNGVWVSANNTSAPISSWPSCVVGPDGVLVASLEHEVPGVLITDVDTSKDFFDGGQRWWRGRVINEGVLHSGRAVVDRQSMARTEIFETGAEHAATVEQANAENS